MRRWGLLVFLPLLLLAAARAQHPAGVTVAQLDQTLAASETAHLSDAALAQQLAGMELTERLSAADLERLKAGLPGENSRQALVVLADKSLFLDPPAAEIPAQPTPDPVALRQMLVAVVHYVNTTLRQLPNFIATRATTRYEDRPHEDLQGAVGVTTLAYVPLHVVGSSTVTVTYRDGHEVVVTAATTGSSDTPPAKGLSSEGVFGPILSAVVGDALKGKITWSRWEKGANGLEAVFHFAVPREKSHYSVGFCCVSNGINTETHAPRDLHSFDEVAAYHGEIAFDPASGAILRITLEAEMPPNEVVSSSQMMVKYDAVAIGGRSYICPLRSVTLLQAHTAPPQPGAQPAESYRKPAQTFLNDSTYEQYHRFGSEVRIVPESSAPPSGGPPASAGPH